MAIDAYVRVSRVRGREGESFLSPTLQRERVEAWAAMRGFEIGEVFEELDESGARADRPLLELAVERIEQGRSDGIVVSCLDRFGRSLLDSLAAIERIERAGGTFASVAEGLDLATETGRLVLRIMLSMAEWELDRVRRQWDDARGKAIARGVHLGGRPPAGYRHGKARGLVVVPKQAAAIRAAFALRAAGATLGEVGAALRAAGVRSATGSTAWPVASARVLLRNRVYLGELHCGGHVHLGAHKAIVDPTTFAAAQAMSGPGRAAGPRTLLGGLLRCANCGAPLHAQRSRGQLAYHGGSRPERRRCCERAPAIARSIAEPYVEWAFFLLCDARAATPRSVALEGLGERLATAQKAVTTFRDDPGVLNALGRDRFVAGLDERVHQERQAAAALHRARDDRPKEWEMGGPAWECRWRRLSISERRVALEALIDRIELSPGTAPVEQRIVVIPKQHVLADGPDRFAPAPPAEPRWSSAAVRHGVAQAVAELGRWPSAEELTARGEGPLLREIELTGGPPRWAREVGVEWRGPLPKGYWTDERIRGALRHLGHWPNRADLQAAGYGGLQKAIERRGTKAWAGELEYRLAPESAAGPTGRWTERTAEKALKDMTKDATTYPSERDFRMAGLGGLERALRVRLGGHDRWARRLKLPRRGPTGGRRPQAVWTDARAEAELRAFLTTVGAERYPTRGTFESHGHSALYRHIQRCGGHAAWARRVGLSRGRRR
jgi:DNA invertase Pin-like site-specific DNA recombinase